MSGRSTTFVPPFDSLHFDPPSSSWVSLAWFVLLISGQVITPERKQQAEIERKDRLFDMGLASEEDEDEDVPFEEKFTEAQMMRAMNVLPIVSAHLERDTHAVGVMARKLVDNLVRLVPASPPRFLERELFWNHLPAN